MAEKLSEDNRRTFEREDVSVKLTVNLQRGVVGVPEALLPALKIELSRSLAALCERLYNEAEQIADMAEALADRLNDSVSGAIIARHCDAAKMSTDSCNSSAYLRVLITSTKRIPQVELFELSNWFMSYFRRLAFDMVRAGELAAASCVDGRA